MAKLRVYELAKELDMPNKDLVEKIDSLGIQIKGHMSSLDEEEVKLVRDMVTGRSQQLIVEKRVRRGVIRRRRKVVKTEPPPEPVEAEIKPEAVPPVEIPAETQLEGTAPTEAPLEEELPTVVDEELTPEAEAEAKVAEEAKPEKKVKKKVEEKERKIKKPRRRVKKEAAAKIIKLPERVAEVVPEEEVKPEEKTEPLAVEPVPPVVAPEPEAEKKPAKAKKKKGRRARIEEEEERLARKKLPSRRKEVVSGEDLYERRTIPGRAMKGRRVARAVAKDLKKTEITVPKAVKRRLRLDEAITVGNLAKRMGIKATEVIRKLMELGLMATLNQAIDFDTAALVAAEFSYETEKGNRNHPGHTRSGGRPKTSTSGRNHYGTRRPRQNLPA